MQKANLATGKTEQQIILGEIHNLEKLMNQVLRKIDSVNEEILTSKEVCRILDIARNHLTYLDSINITEPLYLEDNSKMKYYLRSQIIKIFTDKTHRKPY